MPIIDTHVHYNLEPLAANWQEHWRKAQEYGVEQSIVVGTTFDTSQRAVEIANQAENLFAAVGLHPHYTQDSVASLSNLLNDPKVIAIGETGLDYFRLPSDETRNTVINSQKEAFKAQIELALQHRKFLIIHVRDQTSPEAATDGNAYWDALAILKEYLGKTTPADTTHDPYHNAKALIEKYSAPVPPTSIDFILHCASGPMAYIEEAATLGAYFGVAGNVTYKSADRIREIVKKVPPSRLLLETDAPYLPPVPYRGQPCEPWMISETAKAC